VGSGVLLSGRGRGFLPAEQPPTPTMSTQRMTANTRVCAEGWRLVASWPTLAAMICPFASGPSCVERSTASTRAA
jgi:hypothetical protein